MLSTHEQVCIAVVMKPPQMLHPWLLPYSDGDNSSTGSVAEHCSALQVRVFMSDWNTNRYLAINHTAYNNYNQQL